MDRGQAFHHQQLQQQQQHPVYIAQPGFPPAPGFQPPTGFPPSSAVQPSQSFQPSPAFQSFPSAQPAPGFQPSSGFQPPPGYQPQPIVIQPPVAPSTSAVGQAMRQVLAAKTTKCLGIVLLICGAVMTILQIACTAIVEENGIYAAHSAGTGIWCGLIILVTGIIGCCAAAQKTNALVITFLVMNVLCLLIFSPIMIGVSGGDLDNRRRFCKYHWEDDQRNCTYYNGLLAMTICKLIDAVVVFWVSIWGIAVSATAIHKAKACPCCCACCKDSPSQTQTPIVIYLPVNQIPENAGQPTEPHVFSDQAAAPSNVIPHISGPSPSHAGSQANPPPYKA